MSKYITNPLCPQDGLGEAFKFIIYTMILAEYEGSNFAYTPFENMSHNYDNDPQYVSSKELLINLKANIIPNTPELKATTPTIFYLLTFVERNLNFCVNSNALKLIKQCFNSRKPQKISTNKTNIAVHIRRQNKDDRIKTPEYVPKKVYIEIITNLKRIYPNGHFHIHSQGNIDDFREYKEFSDLTLHLNEPVEKTFTDMVQSDILVIAPSALSYIAGWLSEGKIYYINHCNPPLPTWNVIENYQSNRMYHDYVIPIQTAVLYDAKTGQFLKAL